MATKKRNTVTKKTGTVKAPSVKAETVKEETAKAETVKAEPVKSSTPEKAVEIPKEEKTAAKATSEKKAAVKKPTAKKPAAKKEMKVEAVVEYFGKQVEEKDMIASVKKAWTKAGKKVGDIKSMKLYIKPEESAVYYVINGTDTGSVAF